MILILFLFTYPSAFVEHSKDQQNGEQVESDEEVLSPTNVSTVICPQIQKLINRKMAGRVAEMNFN